MKAHEIKKIVKKRYGEVAKKTSCCGVSKDSSINDKDMARFFGYSGEEINNLSDANLGLGCGNPTAIGLIKDGDIVLDLGSGAGFDCFLAAKKVGNHGKVIGVDMTEEMIFKANENAKKYGYTNVEFRLGDIDHLPVDSNSIDIIISNCVINLAPDKLKVFKETHRVLKNNGLFILTTPDPFFDSLSHLFKKSPHQTTFNLNKLNSLFKEKKLEVVSAEKFMIWPRGLPAELFIEKIIKSCRLDFILLNQIIIGRK